MKKFTKMTKFFALLSKCTLHNYKIIDSPMICAQLHLLFTVGMFSVFCLFIGVTPQRKFTTCMYGLALRYPHRCSSVL